MGALSHRSRKKRIDWKPWIQNYSQHGLGWREQRFSVRAARASWRYLTILCCRRRSNCNAAVAVTESGSIAGSLVAIRLIRKKRERKWEQRLLSGKFPKYTRIPSRGS